MASDNQNYPRPDFERSPLRWQSLNGPWDFIFDEEDVGLSARWQTKGIPSEVSISPATAADNRNSGDNKNSEHSDSITQKIASGTQELIKDNLLTRSAGVNKKTQITVPYVFQSPASGINDRGVHEVLWYERSISDLRTAAEKEKGHRLVARFGAVDYLAKVWVDGRYVGGHRGGHVPFEIDVTDAVDDAVEAGGGSGGSHRLTLRVYDSAYDLTQPRGKQYWGAKPESIFYTPSGGIWQNVWLEVVPAARIADSSGGTVLQSHDIESGKLHSDVAVVGRRAQQKLSVEIEASYAGVAVSKSDKVALPRDKNHVGFDVDMRLSEDQRKSLPEAVLKDAALDDTFAWRDGVALWSPEHPQLYDLTIRLRDESDAVVDEIKTTTGMRSIDWTRGDGHWRLNGRPYFQALCLDQGYWDRTFMTPPSHDACRLDVELGKRMGFNGCRKHQKVEDPLFYYWADRLGYLVWGEMANAYEFGDAAVAGGGGGGGDSYAERFDREWEEAVRLVVNRPCVVAWTPVNESWGYPDLKGSADQRNHVRSLYYRTKTLDPTRGVNDNCGWEHVLSDLSTFHDYADGPELEKTCADFAAIMGPKAGRDLFVGEIKGEDGRKRDAGCAHVEGAPVMCTEFGGVNIAAAASTDQTRDWGYTTASDPADLLKRVDRLVKGVVKGGHCVAFVYTQLADIEQEVNGLYSFDRKEKLDSGKVRELIGEALKMYYDRVKDIA